MKKESEYHQTDMKTTMNKTITFFDTETTDLTMPEISPLNKQPRIIELGIISHNGDKKQTIDSLIDPGIPISSEITKITGIRNKDIRGRPNISTYIDQLRDIFGSSDIVVAHNLSFDKSLVEYEFRRVGAGEVPWPDLQICTVECTEHIKGYRLTLDELYKWCFDRYPKGGRHRAMEDASYTAEIYYHLVKVGEL